MRELKSYTDASASPWQQGEPATSAKPVRRHGAGIDVTPLAELLEGFMAANRHLPGGDRPKTDAYLSPRVHAALRLTRREAADAGMWCWLASTVGHEYTTWRWAGGEAQVVARNRWRGPIHKQSLARLWWGAELFRNGPDYATQLFVHQDTPNSVIHREFARCRPLAVAMDQVLAGKVVASAGAAAGAPGKGPLRRWFAAVNLYAGGRSLDAMGIYHRDNFNSYRVWMQQTPDPDWSGAPIGPDDGRVSGEARTDSFAFLQRIWDEVAGVGGST